MLKYHLLKKYVKKIGFFIHIEGDVYKIFKKLYISGGFCVI